MSRSSAQDAMSSSDDVLLYCYIKFVTIQHAFPSIHYWGLLRILVDRCNWSCCCCCCCCCYAVTKDCDARRMGNAKNARLENGA